MKINIKELKKLDACSDGIDWFENYRGSKELIPLVKKLLTEKCYEKVKNYYVDNSIDWANWLITKYMTKKQLKKYITNPKIYDNSSAFDYASAYAKANANANSYAFADAYAYAFASADVFDDACKDKLTQIVRWGIKIIGAEKVTLRKLITPKHIGHAIILGIVAPILLLLAIGLFMFFFTLVEVFIVGDMTILTRTIKCLPLGWQLLRFLILVCGMCSIWTVFCYRGVWKK